MSYNSRKGNKTNNNSDNSKNQKGKSNYSKGNKRSGRKDCNTKSQTDSQRLDSGYGGNDFSWYNAYPELINATANIPFAYQPGVPVPMGQLTALNKWKAQAENDEVIISNFDYDYPGVAILKWVPSTGASMDAQSPINIAAREVYARIRSKYSGSLEADSPDIMMYILALDSMYAYYSEVQRLYYMLNMWSTNNRYMPVEVINHLTEGKSQDHFDDFLQHKAELYALLGEMQAQLSKFVVPDIMNIFKRHMFLGSNLYLDKPFAKGQIYVFNMSRCLKFTEDDHGTKLIPIIADFRSIEFIRQCWNSMMVPFMNWDTCYTILGYMQRGFENTTWMIPPTTVHEGILQPVFNEEVLVQIENAIVIPLDEDSIIVTQDPKSNNIISQPMTVGNNTSTPRYFKPEFYPINVPTGLQPTPDLVVIATRLMAVPTYVPEDGLDDYSHYVDCGTEIVTNLEVINSQDLFVPGQLQAGDSWDVRASYVAIKDWASIDVEIMLKTLIAANQFNHFPTIGFIYPTLQTENYGMYLSTQMENFTSTSAETLAQLHKMCLYSEFNSFNIGM